MPIVVGRHLGVAIIEQRQHVRLGGERDQPIGLHDGDPQVAVSVEGEAVGCTAQIRGTEGFAVRQRTVRARPQARNAPTVGLDDVQPLFAGVEADLVGPAEPVGDDANALLIDESDITVGDLLVDGARPRHEAGGHREPDPILAVAQDEIGLAQRLTIDLRIQRPGLAVPGHELDVIGAEVGDQDVTVGIESQAIGQCALEHVAFG